MNDHKPPEISEEDQNIITNLLKNHSDLVILGPAGTNSASNHLRIYANGGAIGYVPLSKSAEWKLPTKEYIKHNKDLEEDFATYEKYKKTRHCKDFKQELYNKKDFVDKLIEATDKKSRQKKNKNYDIQRKERAIQTKLVRKYLSEDIKSGFLICDMEHSVPEGETLTGKKPNFDIIIMEPKSGRVGLIELKCNFKACKDKKSGLKAHLADIVECMDLEYVRDNILSRYECLQKAGLISQDLPTADDIEPNFSAFGGFLFIDDGSNTLSTKTDVVKVCIDFFGKDGIEDIKDKKNSIIFLYADSVDNVDFNKMQSWDDFSNS